MEGTEVTDSHLTCLHARYHNSGEFDEPSEAYAALYVDSGFFPSLIATFLAKFGNF